MFTGEGKATFEAVLVKGNEFIWVHFVNDSIILILNLFYSSLIVQILLITVHRHTIIAINA